jgi:hypothetical protein
LAASLLPMLPMPTMATVLSEIVTWSTLRDVVSAGSRPEPTPMRFVVPAEMRAAAIHGQALRCPAAAGASAGSKAAENR